MNKLDATCKRVCMATSRDRYYTEMYETLTDYNDCNNILLSNENIREAIREVIEEESISDSNNLTVDTFSHTSNTQIENANEIFTSEKLDKLYKLEDTLKDFTNQQRQIL